MGKNNDLLTTTIEYGVVTNNKTSEGGNIMKRNRSLFLLATLVVILLVTFTGCKKEPEPVVPQTSEEPVVSSEEVSETPSSEEVSEPTSEETSEPESEPAPEIVDGVQTVKYDSAEELESFVDSLEGTVIAVYNFFYKDKGQALLYDGAYYNIPEDFTLDILSQKGIASAITTAENVSVGKMYIDGYGDKWFILIQTTGTDIEVPVTITYDDGTEENFTIYVTKEWKFSGEE